MQLSFRWYGPDDPVRLEYIRQIPRMAGIVTSLAHIPTGQVWSEHEVATRADLIKKHGMHWVVAESLNVHEEIKWGSPRRDELIENYRISLGNMKGRVPVVCYNFMPICDWMRTKLHDAFDDGSTGLSYYQKDMSSIEPEDVLDWKMPAWAKLTKDEMRELRRRFEQVDESALRENLRYFLRAVVPAAQEAGIKLAIHPDDPPWSIFGLPRVVKNKSDLQAIVDMVDSPANGITFCSGSLGSDGNNDLVAMIKHFGGLGRIHFAHSRNVQRSSQNDKDFREVAHALQNPNAVDIAALMHAYKEIKFTGPMRPDHGRTIWGETGTVTGYGLYDRALGAMYLQGLWDARG